MKKSLLYLLFSLLISIVPAIAFSQNYSITVTVIGLHSNNGKVIMYLYKTADGYPADHSRAFKTSSSAISGNKCTITFTPIPKGTYAIAYFHDEDNNGQLNTNFLGIPSEGVGASNNAKGFMGPPKYEDAKFLVEGNISLILTISY